MYLYVKEGMNNCPNRLKCITQDKDNGGLFLSNFCLSGQKIKFYFREKEKRPVIVRARISTIYSRRNNKGWITCGMVKKGRKWFGRQRLLFPLQDIKVFEYPILCQEGRKRLEGSALIGNHF